MFLVERQNLADLVWILRNDDRNRIRPGVQTSGDTHVFEEPFSIFAIRQYSYRTLILTYDSKTGRIAVPRYDAEGGDYSMVRVHVDKKTSKIDPCGGYEFMLQEKPFQHEEDGELFIAGDTPYDTPTHISLGQNAPGPDQYLHPRVRIIPERIGLIYKDEWNKKKGKAAIFLLPTHKARFGTVPGDKVILRSMKLYNLVGGRL